MSEESKILPMTEELAEEIAAWEYPGEYAVYNLEGDTSGLLDGNSYAVRNIAGELVGFYQFGKEARIPAEEDSAYPEGPLDMGLGLRPDLCGLRLGQPFAAAGVKFAREELGAEELRLTVADFNQRARKVYTYCGFFTLRRATHQETGEGFIVMGTENLKYHNSLSAGDYCSLRAAVGFSPICPEQAEVGLCGSAYVVGCRDGELAVGAARLLWDGGYTAYLTDVMVLPEYQGLGIGTQLVERCMLFLRMQLRPGWRFKVHLLAGKDRDSFYEKFGFTQRPNEDAGPAMDMWME